MPGRGTLRLVVAIVAASWSLARWSVIVWRLRRMEVVGVSALLDARELGRWYGQVVGLNELTVDDRGRRDRAARPERRGQVDAPAS